MDAVSSLPRSGLASLVGRLQALFTSGAVTPSGAHAEEASPRVLMQAAVAAAVHVIMADGEAAEGEFAVAADGLQANIVEDGHLETDELTEMLHAAASQARTRSGRIANLQAVSALTSWPMSRRQAVFLLAADVADVEGTSGIEERALAEVAAALDVSRTALSDARMGLTAV